MFYLRLFFVVLIRFMLFITLAAFAENFEVSPLPAWTLTAFVYVMHLLITYVAVLWAYRKEMVTTRHTTAILTTFTVGEFLLECGLFLVLTQGNFSGLVQSFTWKIIFLMVIYFIGAGAGLWQIKSRRGSSVVPATPPTML